MPSRNYTLFFILSVGFVLVSIAFITILGQTSSSNNGSDIRAKATVQNSLQLIGTLSNINPAERTVLVDNVQFAGNESSSPMGTFTAKLDESISPAGLIQGADVQMAVDAASFQIGEKTFTILSLSNQ